MAVDITLKIEGVDGESRIKAFEDQIDVIHWSWSINNSGDMHSGMGGGSGKVDVDTLNIQKYVDKSTPALMRSCCVGKHFEKAELSIRKAGGEAVEYLKMVMKPVLITSVSSSGSGMDDRLEESITLSFAKFEVYYTPQKDDGTAETPIDFKFSIEQNAEE